MKTEIWIVYQLFDYEDDYKWKNFELQSCRSRGKLQFSYKVYLHPCSNKKLQNFENRLDPYCVAHGGSRCYSTARVRNTMGHSGRSLPLSLTALDVSLCPKKNDVLGFKICKKKNDVLLNLAVCMCM
jgi:hypothetical protein